MNSADLVAVQLGALVQELTGYTIPLDDAAATAGPLWNFGMTSSDVIRLLNGVEDRFCITWSLDDSAEAFSSFDALVAHIAQHGATVPEAVPVVATDRDQR